METVDLIELHDSVIRVRLEANELVLELQPAYVHHWAQVGERGGEQGALKQRKFG
jgi:hypothetical protein